MDPNLFHLDYERLMEVLVTIVVLSFFVERALSVIFESRPFIEWSEGTRKSKKDGDSNSNNSKDTPKKKKGIKEFFSLVVSVSVCWAVQFDALTIILASNDEVTKYGIVLTGAIVAGGSKASIKFFKDVMGFMSSAERERMEAKKLKKT